MTLRGRGRLAISLLFLIAGCSGGAGTIPTATEVGRGPDAADSPSPGASASTEAEPSTTAPPTTLVSRLEFDVGQIEATAPVSGGGTRPELEWEAVEGAQEYRVTVFAPNGDPYWATQTDNTRVHVGGEPQLNEQTAGPSIIPGMTWRIIALDPDRKPLAVSDRMLISP